MVANVVLEVRFEFTSSTVWSGLQGATPYSQWVAYTRTCNLCRTFIPFASFRR